jgi:RNA polymerase sigma-70 factor, ECF subfamily
VIDDEQLIADTLKGDSQAFGKLVEKYQDRLYNTLVHIIGNVEDARDIVQESFVQAFVKLDSFRGMSAFYTWLYRIALNMAAGHQRRQRSIASLEYKHEQNGMDPMDKGKTPSEQLEKKELAQQVQSALQLLSDEHRIILVLREIGGSSYETIAELLDLPVGTIRSRIHRARMQLREEIKKIIKNDGQTGREHLQTKDSES